MNEHGTRTTKVEKSNFPFEEYPYINFTGTFIVTLTDKTWEPAYDSHYLICGFQTEDNIKFRINIWRNPEKEIYAPRYSDIDFSKADLNTHWKCTFIITRFGNIRCNTAVPIAKD